MPDKVLVEVMIKLAPTFFEENFAKGFKVTFGRSAKINPDKVPPVKVAISVAS